MKKNHMMFLVVLFCLAAGLSAAKPKAFAGTWEGTTDTPNGTDAITLNLEWAKKTWTGRMKDTLGLIPDVEVANVQINQETISFSISIPNPQAGGTMEVTFSLELKDKTLSGTWSIAEGMSGAVTLEKKN